ncbi:DUF4190 domain-containing protein [Schumannella sp. 10F1B-5-1]|uniref:DUF4190 domain-containing protein n=1 Tax=Schumannella sp. 10F1B-5-1 TaxID=2590780 RepID=UPI0011303814|nr:DUF4190 domain-containing protein [Schumannella sp. 10F1B-5-1]TPW76928.1 DUF4190 domain-containing protein [Schumannella sp. 10F1B-5-1]
MTDTNAPAVANAPAKKRSSKGRASAAVPETGASAVTEPAAPISNAQPADAIPSPQPAASTPLPLVATALPPTTAPAAASAARSRAMGIASMVLGIIAFCGFGLVAPIGLVLGAASWRKEPTGKGFAITGLALNVLSILTWIVVAIVVVIGFALAGYGVTIR